MNMVSSTTMERTKMNILADYGSTVSCTTSYYDDDDDDDDDNYDSIINDDSFDNDSRLDPKSNDEINNNHNNNLIVYWNVFQKTFCNYFYPKNVPWELHILDLRNIGIPISYLFIGIVDGMIRPVLNVYPIDLAATESQQTVLMGISQLPAAFKLLYGFMSDTLPINGYRRKSYMYIGWMLSCITMLSLLCNYDLHLPTSPSDPTETSTTIAIHTRTMTSSTIQQQQQPPSIEILGLLFFLYGVGMWVADVMADAIVAQKVRYESTETSGNLQSTCYVCRFFGLMISAPISTYIYELNHGPILNIHILCIAPLLILPFIYMLYEERYCKIDTPKQQCYEIWNTVCSRSVWQPLGFLFVFNIFQVKNAAWKQYLTTALHFSSYQLNLLLIISYVLLYAGTVTYKFCFIHTNWRRLYQITILFNVVLSMGQIVLITDTIPFGLDPFLFALGDDAFAEFVSGIQFLPCTILMVSLCPIGSEGASYAMFTTVWNSAMLLTPSISTMLLRLWDVSIVSLENGIMDGMIKLTILTTILQSIPILFVQLLPRGRNDLIQLSGQEQRSFIGGCIFLIVLFGSMMYMLSVTVLNIVYPGWAGET